MQYMYIYAYIYAYMLFAIQISSTYVLQVWPFIKTYMHVPEHNQKMALWNMYEKQFGGKDTYIDAYAEMYSMWKT